MALSYSVSKCSGLGGVGPTRTVGGDKWGEGRGHSEGHPSQMGQGLGGASWRWQGHGLL